MEDIILQYTYPRLDAEVSKHRNHLLKAPFCVHPKTGRVCVPVDPTRVEEFDPETVPTVGQLLSELNRAEKMEGNADEGTLSISYPSIIILTFIRMASDFVKTVRRNVERPFSTNHGKRYENEVRDRYVNTIQVEREAEFNQVI